MKIFSNNYPFPDIDIELLLPNLFKVNHEIFNIVISPLDKMRATQLGFLFLKNYNERKFEVYHWQANQKELIKHFYIGSHYNLYHPYLNLTFFLKVHYLIISPLCMTVECGHQICSIKSE